jgi:endonuclease G
VDGRAEKRKPDPEGDYTRKGLTGLGKSDQEEWVTDPRIPEQDQLPDRFYNKDRQAFDKGHLVRREDMAWGDDFAQVRRANNDTYHTTNCSPQVSNFNQSAKGGTWGQLENEILDQAKDRGDRYTLFTGPILAGDDRWFDGKDDRGDVRIQIPRRFWKVVVTVTGSRIQAFGFVLEQSLARVKFQEAFQLSEEWQTSLYALADLQHEIGVVFPANVLEADQYDGAGQEIAKAIGATRRARVPGQAPARSNGSPAALEARP